MSALSTGAGFGFALGLVYTQVCFVQAFHPERTVFAVLLVLAGLSGHHSTVSHRSASGQQGLHLRISEPPV